MTEQYKLREIVRSSARLCSLEMVAVSISRNEKLKQHQQQQQMTELGGDETRTCRSLESVPSFMTSGLVEHGLHNGESVSISETASCAENRMVIEESALWLEYLHIQPRSCCQQDITQFVVGSSRMCIAQVTQGKVKEPTRADWPL